MKYPGVVELAKVYGQYDELVRISNEYLGLTKPKIPFKTTNSTT